MGGGRWLPIVFASLVFAAAPGIDFRGPSGTPSSPTCAIEVSQDATTYAVEPVEGAQSVVSFYDYNSASAHTPYVEAYASVLYLYLDTSAGTLHFVFHFNIDAGGSGDARTTVDLSGIPSGAGAELSDDPFQGSSQEFTLSRSIEGQFDYFSNTDGGILGPLPTTTEWSMSAVIVHGGPDPMRTQHWIDADGAKLGLALSDSITISRICNEAPTADAGGPYAGSEGATIAFNAGGSSDPDGDALTYTWDFEDDGVDDLTTASPTATHAYPDDFVGMTRLTVSDGSESASALAHVTISNAPPEISPFGPGLSTEGASGSLSAQLSDPGHDALTAVWEFELGPTISDSFPASGPPTKATSTATFLYGDDGSYGMKLMVTDDDGASSAFETAVEVANAPPTVRIMEVRRPGAFTLRVAGEKWHDVTATFSQDGALVAALTVVRTPGSPDEQSASTGVLDLSPASAFTASVVYTPEDDPVNGQPNGANPAWILIGNGADEPIRLHHTFNAQQPDTYRWDVDLTPYVASLAVTFEADASDPGSDDLLFSWDFGGGASAGRVVYNDGVAGDAPKSPAGTFPFTARDAISHAFPGPGTYVVTLTATDDDGGAATAEFTITILG